MVAQTPQDIANALRYGPQVQQQMRRSAYLADALRSMQTQEQPIRSGWELGAKLLATAILNRQANKANDAALGAIRADREATAQSLLAGLRGPGAQTAAPKPSMPPPSTTPAPDPVAQADPFPVKPPEAVQQAALPAAVGPDDRDALIRMLATEAIGEGPEGMAAAGHVALNRLRAGHMGAKSLRDVVFAPNQFEGMSRANQVKPEEYETAAKVADAILAGQMPDPTGGAVNFLNPDLQVEMGREIPSWARGQGQRIGRHVFFGGKGPQAPDVQMVSGPAPATPLRVEPTMAAAQAVPPPPMPPDPSGPDVQPALPVQLAGPLQPGMIPSEPGSSPSADGAPPAANPPQAPAAGGMPQQQWPTWRPTEAQIEWVSELLSDPRTYEAGVAEARKYRAKMAEPAPAKIVEMNGVQFYVSEVPGQGGAPVMIPVPQAAMTRQVSAQTINPTAPAGLQAQVDPLGNVKEGIGGPPENMQAVRSPDGQLRYVPVQGSREDPYRVQAPGPGYRYTDGGVQAPITGSPADLKAPTNVMEGANRYGGMVKTIVDGAMKVKQNYGAVVTGFKQQNGPGDIAMTNGIQKLIDEGVVKGEDVNMQMRANGLQGTLGSWQQYAQSGGVFTPEIRKMIYKTATDLYKNLDNTYRVRVMSLAPGFDEAYGQGAFGKYVFPEAFAAELGWTGDAEVSTPASGPATPAALPASAEAAWNQLRAAGKIDDSKPFGDELKPFVARDAATLQKLDKPENRDKWVIGPDGRLGRIK